MQLTLFETVDLINCEKENIGKIAGNIWGSLSEREKTLKELIKDLFIDSDTLLLSIGWLVQEEKLTIYKKGKKIFFKLK